MLPRARGSFKADAEFRVFQGPYQSWNCMRGRVPSCSVPVRHARVFDSAAVRSLTSTLIVAANATESLPMPDQCWPGHRPQSRSGRSFCIAWIRLGTAPLAAGPSFPRLSAANRRTILSRSLKRHEARHSVLRVRSDSAEGAPPSGGRSGQDLSRLNQGRHGGLGRSRPIWPSAVPPRSGLPRSYP